MNNLKQELVSFPSPFQRALLRDDYSKGDSQFSVTGLLSPPLRTWLATLHKREESAYGSFSALLGTAIHHILESNVDASTGEIAEKRVFAEICGAKVSGQMDLWENRTMFDYKSTRGVQDCMKPDHYKQVNMNAYLAKLNGIESDNVAVVYIQMDWSYMQSTVNPSYPQSPFKIFIHPYDEKMAVDTFNKAIPEHLEALKGNARLCSKEEKWQKDDTYALMKPDGKRASKVCNTLEEAKAEIKPGQIIQVRKGERTFCDNFCGFKEHCYQYKQETLEINNKNNEP